jgi:hypothetical protein
LLLTGMPTIGPDPLFKLWLALGFQLHFPVGTLRWGYPTNWADTPSLILDLLFRPQKLNMIVISWTGNVWLWLGAVALCAHLLRLRRARAARAAAMGNTDALPAPSIAGCAADRAIVWPGIGLMSIAFVVMLCWGFAYRGGDGNYFIAGIVPAILLGFAAAWRSLPLSLHRPLFVAAVGFGLFAASYSFVSGWWINGTRGFDTDFQRSAHLFRRESRLGFREKGILRITEYLRALHHEARVVGCTEFGGALGFHLPARFEDIGAITFSRPEFPSSKAHFVDFLKTDRIDYLLAPRAAVNAVQCPGGEVVARVAADLSGDPGVPAVQDERYVLYDIRSWQQQ